MSSGDENPTPAAAEAETPDEYIRSIKHFRRLKRFVPLINEYDQLDQAIKKAIVFFTDTEPNRAEPPITELEARHVACGITTYKILKNDYDLYYRNTQGMSTLQRFMYIHDADIVGETYKHGLNLNTRE